MRNINQNALKEIAKAQGTEPINVIGVTWVKDGNEIFYCDKLANGVEARILSLANLSTSIDQEGNSSVGEVSVTLIDTDGALKNIIDHHDVHKRPVTIYQWFQSLAFSDKFPIFSGGLINSPVVWNEDARTLSFSIISKLENNEAGFSTASGHIRHKGQIEQQNWPLCFGDVILVPATSVNQNTTGKLLTPFGLIDPMLELKAQVLQSRLALHLSQNAYIQAYDAALQSGVPSATQIRREYIEVMGEQDSLNRSIRANIDIIDKIEDAIKTAINQAQIDVLTRRKQSVEQQIQRLSQQVAETVQRKNSIQGYIDLLNYVNQTHSDNVSKMDQLIKQTIETSDQLLQVLSAIQKQSLTERSSVQIEDGRYFEQETELDIFIGNLRFSGIFHGDNFTFTAQGQPKYREIPCSGNFDHFNIPDQRVVLEGLFCLVMINGNAHIVHVNKQFGNTCYFDLQLKQDADPSSPGDYEGGGTGINTANTISQDAQVLIQQVNADLPDADETRDIEALDALVAQEQELELPNFEAGIRQRKYVIQGEDFDLILEASPIIQESWINLIDYAEVATASSNKFFAEAGAEVTLAVFERLTHVANILPSTIYGVYAYRTIGNRRVVAELPTSFYTKDGSQVVGDLVVETITLEQRLSQYVNQGWEDEIYVTLRSTIGPNVCDIISWLITKYTTYGIDSASFADVKGKLLKYPANFALLEPRDVVSLIKDIAYQSRCAIYLSGNNWIIRYLSAESQPLDEIKNDDILLETTQTSITDTEAVATKIISNWRKNYLPESEQKIVLQHNIARYGVKEREINFFIYTDYRLVEKSATFWLIRDSNTWRNISFATPLTKLNLEPLDTITLNLTGPLSTYNGSAVVNSVDYDSSGTQIGFTLWLPIRIGETTKYELAYPSTSGLSFPSAEDITNGDAGSYLNVTANFADLTDGDDRPADWGREVMSDSADSILAQPLDTFQSYASSVSSPDIEEFPVPPYPEDLKDLLSHRKSTSPIKTRETHVGVVIKADDAKNLYTVALQNGVSVDASIYSKLATDKIRTGTPCTIILGESPNVWWILAKYFEPEIRVFIVNEVFDDYYICTNEEGEKDIVINKPYDFVGLNYSSKTDSRGYLMTYVSETERTLTRGTVILNQTLIGVPEVNARIFAAKAPFGLENDSPWFDLNNQGTRWVTKEMYNGYAANDYKIITDFSGFFSANLDNESVVNVLIKQYEKDYLISANERLVVSYNEQNDLFYLVEHITKAKHVIAKLKVDTDSEGGPKPQQLYRADSTISLSVVKYWDGINPGTDIQAANTLRIAAIGQDKLLCCRDSTGTYQIVDVRHYFPVNIRFKLTGTLITGGVAKAKILEFNRDNSNTLITTEDVNVWDQQSQFKGDVNSIGYAILIPDKDRYDIISIGIKPIIVRFKLTATLNRSGSASAVLRQLDTIGNMQDGGIITVHDIHGAWNGISGMFGYGIMMDDFDKVVPPDSETVRKVEVLMMRNGPWYYGNTSVNITSNTQVVTVAGFSVTAPWIKNGINYLPPSAVLIEYDAGTDSYVIAEAQECLRLGAP